MEEAQSGFLTRLSLLQRSGQQLHLVLKGWAVKEKHLRWDLARLLPYTGWSATAHVPQSKYISVNMPTWCQHLNSLRLPIPPIGQSARSARCKADQGMTSTELEPTQWVSTGGLLALLMYFSRKRKAVEAKEQCRRVLTAFIRHTLDGEAARQLLSATPDSGVYHLCHVGDDGSGQCQHAQQFFEDLASPFVWHLSAGDHMLLAVWGLGTAFLA